MTKISRPTGIPAIGAEEPARPEHLVRGVVPAERLPEVAQDLLVQPGRAAAVADEARHLRTMLDKADASEVHMIEVHYLLARLEHDERWLTATADRIETGELRWP